MVQSLQQSTDAHKRLTVRIVYCGYQPYLPGPAPSTEQRLLQAQMADPQIASNPKEFQEIAKKTADLEAQVTCLANMQSAERELEGARSMLKEAEGRYLPF